MLEKLFIGKIIDEQRNIKNNRLEYRLNYFRKNLQHVENLDSKQHNRSFHLCQNTKALSIKHANVAD